ncbi:MAG: dUTP diphosphatase [Clostridia bacterium]|nr:dUTP diphosphatase [Clostridia bacterium]
MKLKVKKLRPDAVLPVYGSLSAAGADLRSAEEGDILIPAGETRFIGTGLALEIPDGYVGLVYARSGLAAKRGLAPANCVGVIDSDYRGEVKVALYNRGKEDEVVEKGERIAQIVITPYLAAEYEEAENLGETARGEGGFGSTGRK